MTDQSPTNAPTPIYLVSGGPGAVGQLLLDTLLAQFPDVEVSVTCVKDLRTIEHLNQVLQSASDQHAFVIHALVDTTLRARMVCGTKELGLDSHDVFGELLDKFERLFNSPPISAPGRYRALRREYFERVEAIEYAIEHDDSQNLHSIDAAEIVLIGVSRTGKTPLSMYLAMLGYKTANVTFIPNIPWPEELNRVERGRLVGLIIERERLLAHRKQRSVEVGLGRGTPYSSEESLFHELEALYAAFKKHRIPIIDVTEKPLETTAHEVVQLVTRTLGTNPRRS